MSPRSLITGLKAWRYTPPPGAGSPACAMDRMLPVAASLT